MFKTSTDTKIDERKAREFLIRQEEAKKWIEQMIGIQFQPGNVASFCEQLRNGVFLAQLGETVAPGSTKKIHHQPLGSVLEMLSIDNYAQFFASCKSIGFPPIYFFSVPDLWEMKNAYRVVHCIHRLEAFLAKRTALKARIVRLNEATVQFNEQEIQKAKEELKESAKAMPATSMNLSMEDEEEVQVRSVASHTERQQEEGLNFDEVTFSIAEQTPLEQLVAFPEPEQKQPEMMMQQPPAQMVPPVTEQKIMSGEYVFGAEFATQQAPPTQLPPPQQQQLPPVQPPMQQMQDIQLPSLPATSTFAQLQSSLLQPQMQQQHQHQPPAQSFDFDPFASAIPGSFQPQQQIQQPPPTMYHQQQQATPPQQQQQPMYSPPQQTSSFYTPIYGQQAPPQQPTYSAPSQPIIYGAVQVTPLPERSTVPPLARPMISGWAQQPAPAPQPYYGGAGYQQPPMQPQYAPPQYGAPPAMNTYPPTIYQTHQVLPPQGYPSYPQPQMMQPQQQQFPQHTQVHVTHVTNVKRIL